VSNDGEVDSNSTAKFSHTLNRSGTITRIYAESYPGQETDVEYHCELIPDGGGQAINLIAQASDDALGYLIGNDQTWNFPIRRDFSMDDEIRFKYVNNDSNNSHNVHLRVHVDYEGSMIDRLRGGGGGWF